jgi:acyl-CoA thioester hydrolase
VKTKTRPRRDDYRYLAPLTTRWADNDVYGHVNNAHYYALFDTAVNRFLVEAGGLDFHRGAVIGYVVASECRYFDPVAYPDALEVGVRVEHLGTSSVRYAVALFRDGDEAARAAGAMVHVFVDRASGRPTPLPGPLRAALETIFSAPEGAARGP